MRKLILKCGLSPGDILMLTAAVRDLHRCYPREFLTDVRTRCPELWENNPYLTPLSDFDRQVESIECNAPLIDRCNEEPYHYVHGYIDFLNRHLGLRIRPTEFKGDVHLSELEKSWYSQVHEVTGLEVPFWIVAAGGKYDVTIKWWDQGRYQDVIDHFRGRVQFVQIGALGHYHPKLEGVIDLRGQTTLRELVRLVYHSQGALCSITALMHLAAAIENKHDPQAGRPCVVIAGGREPTHWEAYPEHQFIHTTGSLKCCSRGGCWRDRSEPLGDGDERDGEDHLCLDRVGQLPRCMNMITAAEVMRRIECYFEGGMLQYLSPTQRSAAASGQVATAENTYDDQPLTLHNARLACEKHITSLPSYPDRFANRGIVICAGGLNYFTNAWVCARVLRHLGCSLPIQFWYLGRAELDEEMEGLVAPLGVECVDATLVRRVHPMRRLHGWELKPYALVHSPFREVILLDADNVPLIDPEILFDTPEFRQHGAIFWPDFGHLEKAGPIWHNCGLDRSAHPDFESGQMVVDKQRCWEALALTLWFNAHSDFYYRYIYGDKDTFHLAFRKLAAPYAMIPHPIEPLVGAMCQHDFAGNRIFQHRNTAKWNFHGKNRSVPGFLHEEECMAYLFELRKKWSGRIRRYKQPVAEAL